MEKVIKRIQIDLYSPTCYEVIKAQQGDNNLRVIEFEIFADGEPYTLENVTARLEGHRGDGSSFIKDCSILDNIISSTLDADVLYDAGYIEAKVVLSDTSSYNPDTGLSDTISTIPFKIHVQKNPCDKSEVVEKKSIVDQIMAMVDSLKGIKDDLLALINSKAEKVIYGDNSINLGRKEGTTIGNNSVALGSNTTAIASCSHAEGASTTAIASCSHAEGYETTASGMESHAEGRKTTASGDYSHAEGASTKATAIASHAEGMSTKATGSEAHAEGYDTTASDSQSHAEGYKTVASGEGSHAENGWCQAKGSYSHAEGISTIASGESQHVQGKYNVEDTEGKYAHIVGGGIGSANRKNIHTLDWNGNAEFAGDVVAHDADGNSVSLLSVVSDGYATYDGDGNAIVDTYAKKSIYGDTSIDLGGKTFGENSVILGGYSNTSYSQYTYILGGHNDKIDNNCDYSVIICGQNNIIKRNSMGAAILCGSNSKIDTDYTPGGIILGGNYAIINSKNSHAIVCGDYNNPDDGGIFQIGNGNSEDNRSNAFVLDTEGNGTFAGNVIGKNILSATYIDFTVTTEAYTNALGGYRGIIDISSLVPNNIKGIIFNRCVQQEDSNRVGIASIGSDFHQVIVNAGNASTYNVSATVLYT